MPPLRSGGGPDPGGVSGEESVCSTRAPKPDAGSRRELLSNGLIDSDPDWFLTPIGSLTQGHGWRWPRPPSIARWGRPKTRREAETWEGLEAERYLEAEHAAVVLDAE